MLVASADLREIFLGEGGRWIDDRCLHFFEASIGSNTGYPKSADIYQFSPHEALVQSRRSHRAVMHWFACLRDDSEGYAH